MIETILSRRPVDDLAIQLHLCRYAGEGNRRSDVNKQSLSPIGAVVHDRMQGAANTMPISSVTPRNGCGAEQLSEILASSAGVLYGAICPSA
jgi:hypothetical protein